MRVAALFVLLVSGCGGGGEEGSNCKENSVVVDVTLDGVTAGADTLEIMVSDGQTPELTSRFAHTPGDTTDGFELDFDRFGVERTFTLRALSGSTTLGSATYTFAPGGRCGLLPITVKPPAQ
jgi:hypothetical protein